MLRTIDGIIRGVLVVLIRGYQLVLSGILPRSCRFYPSCSEYAVEALREKSLPVAMWLIVRRITRCHPFHPGGYDPVP